jgi:hypothetical protein
MDLANCFSHFLSLIISTAIHVHLQASSLRRCSEAGRTTGLGRVHTNDAHMALISFGKD